MNYNVISIYMSMRPPAPIGIFDTSSEDQRMKTLNYRVFQDHHGTTVSPVIGDGFFQMPADIRSQNNIGINTNPMLMSLGCRSVQEANHLVKMGTSSPFNGSNYNVNPPSWKSKQSSTTERFGFSHDFKQKPIILNTWQ